MIEPFLVVVLWTYQNNTIKFVFSSPKSGFLFITNKSIIKKNKYIYLHFTNLQKIYAFKYIVYILAIMLSKTPDS